MPSPLASRKDSGRKTYPARRAARHGSPPPSTSAARSLRFSEDLFLERCALWKSHSWAGPAPRASGKVTAAATGPEARLGPPAQHAACLAATGTRKVPRCPSIPFQMPGTDRSCAVTESVTGSQNAAPGESLSHPVEAPLSCGPGVDRLKGVSTRPAASMERSVSGATTSASSGPSQDRPTFRPTCWASVPIHTAKQPRTVSPCGFGMTPEPPARLPTKPPPGAGDHEGRVPAQSPLVPTGSRSTPLLHKLLGDTLYSLAPC
ncbi:hypothetical protein J1605_009327 [Eschrichtius robustus]|uniref:Uncharacterized protein n=1 Tax=Eschrichtius robustus TaxID=9764 RepID=A0AB34GXW1_ESCRO|nr:hypothetical protein J1605_009327 [Eschrichtius robustus]